MSEGQSDPGPHPEALDDAARFIDAVRHPVVLLDDRLCIGRANPWFLEHFGTCPGGAEGRSIYEVGEGRWDIPRLRALLEVQLPGNPVVDDYEIVHDFGRVGRQTLLLNAHRRPRDGTILLAIEDVTGRVAAEARLRETERGFRFLDEIEEVIRSLEDPGLVMATVSRLLGNHLAASRCAYAEVEDDGDRFSIRHDFHAAGSTSVVGDYRLGHFTASAHQAPCSDRT